MNFDAAADELHRREYAFLRAFVTPRPEQLRSMTIGELRIENALMWERIGHTLHTGPDAAELVTIKGERKFITICANPADPAPTGSAALRPRERRRVDCGQGLHHSRGSHIEAVMRHAVQNRVRN